VILGRKLSYSLTGTLMVAPMEQLLTMIFLLTLFAAVFLQARPYDKASLDVMVGAYFDHICDLHHPGQEWCSF